MVQLSIRGRYHDIFWFTLFHELGHVLLHGRREVFVNFERPKSGTHKGVEEEADQFASDALIPATSYARYLAAVAGNHVSEAGVRAFAEQLGVHPSIVVGRLQHDGKLPPSHLNGLRPKMAWSADA